MNKSIINLIGLLFIASVSMSQKVVLINGNAAQVELNGSEVVSISKIMPDYMIGYKKAPADAFKKNNPIAEPENVYVAEDTGQAIPGITTDSALNEMTFAANKATLTDSTMEALKRYARKILEEKSSSVSLKSWHKLDDPVSQQLASNRLDACKRFLEINGVQGSLIFTSFTATHNPVDYVTISLQ